MSVIQLYSLCPSSNRTYVFISKQIISSLEPYKIKQNITTQYWYNNNMMMMVNILELNALSPFNQLPAQKKAVCDKLTVHIKHILICIEYLIMIYYIKTVYGVPILMSFMVIK